MSTCSETSRWYELSWRVLRGIKRKNLDLKEENKISMLGSLNLNLQNIYRKTIN